MKCLCHSCAQRCQIVEDLFRNLVLVEGSDKEVRQEGEKWVGTTLCVLYTELLPSGYGASLWRWPEYKWVI